MASTTASSRTNKWNMRRMFHRSASSNVADIISTHTDDLHGDTEFFASLEKNTSLAFYDKDEVQLGALLGKGTFTEIYAVAGVEPKNTTDNSSSGNAVKELGAGEYAMKHLTPAALNHPDPKMVARAARELVNDAKYLARLNHPNIVQLRGLTKDAFGRNYLARQFHDFFTLMDRVSDHTLHDKIYNEWRTHGQEPDEDHIPMKANYAFQLAKALRYCHEQGVLYRDLKPTNVGFSRSDPHCLQLLDFGLARDFSSEQHNMTLAGTRRYLAGEVLTAGRYSWKSDVYSWAMVYYEMCAERKPYLGLTASEHQHYVCEYGTRPPLDDYYLPEAVDDILTNSWHPVLHKRWSMNQVCYHLQDFLMQLDLCYYQPQEGDFLFDVEIHGEHVESWSEEWGTLIPEWGMEGLEHIIHEEVQEPTTMMLLDYSDPEMKVSSECDGSKSQRRASLSSVQPVTPRKIISSAA